MTEQRRAASRLAKLALGLVLLAAVLLVVPGTSATTAPSTITYLGSGSTTVTTQTALGRPGLPTSDSGDESTGADPGEARSDQTLDAQSPTESVHQPDLPDRSRRFTISVGNVSGLYPGRLQRIPIVFHNPQNVDISVRTATTTATGPPDCPLETSLILRTRTFIHRVVVPAHGSKAKSLRFGMRKAATDGCQNGVFTITVTANASRA